MPSTRAGFRAIVEQFQAAAVAGDEGAAVTFAALVNLSMAFSEVTPALGEAASAAEQMASRIDTIFSQLSDMWSDQIDNWKQLADEAGRIADMAGSAARSLRGQVADTRQWDARAASGVD